MTYTTDSPAAPAASNATIGALLPPRAAILLAPSAELPAGFPLPVGTADTPDVLLQWYQAALRAADAGEQSLVRVPAGLLRRLLDLNDEWWDDKAHRITFCRFADLPGPPDVTWSLHASRLQAVPADVFQRTRAEAAGAARIGQTVGKKVQMPKRFAESRAQLTGFSPADPVDDDLAAPGAA